jgi:uncharacterized protein YacL
MAKPIILDTSALAHRKAVVLAFREKFINGSRVIMPRSVSRETGRLRTSPYQDKREVGEQAALALIELHSLPGIKVTMDSREPTTEDTDTDLLAVAEAVQGQILTADGELQDRAQAKGIGVIDMQALCCRLRLLASEINDIFPPSRDLKQGDLLTVHIVKLGQRPGQGIGYLEDGRMVVVEDGASYLGGELDVIVKTILQTSPGAELIFAVPVAETAPAQVSE